jgi:hypothetical protein
MCHFVLNNTRAELRSIMSALNAVYAKCIIRKVSLKLLHPVPDIGVSDTIICKTVRHALAGNRHAT